MSDGVFRVSWLDVGIESMHAGRDLFGGAGQAGSAGDGDGTVTGCSSP